MRNLGVFAVAALTAMNPLAFAAMEPPAVEWERTFGRARWDDCGSAQQTTDGGYIIVGTTTPGPGVSGSGSSDIYVIKTDDNGNEMWSQTLGGEHEEVGQSIQQTSDGGYVIAGYQRLSGRSWLTDVYLSKTDGTGNEVWSRTFGGEDIDKGESVQQTIDGGYIVAGWTKSFGAGERDIYVIKTNAEGDEV